MTKSSHFSNDYFVKGAGLLNKIKYLKYLLQENICFNFSLKLTQIQLLFDRIIKFMTLIT